MLLITILLLLIIIYLSSIILTLQQIRFLCLSQSTPEFADAGSIINNIGACLYSLSRFQEARAYFSAALDVFLPILAAVHPRITTTRSNLEKVQTKSRQVKLDLSGMQQLAAKANANAVAQAAPGTTVNTVALMPPHLVKGRARNVQLTVYQKMLIDSQQPKKPAPKKEKKK